MKKEDTKQKKGKGEYTNKEILEQFTVDATPKEIKKHIKEGLSKLPKGSEEMFGKMLTEGLSDYEKENVLQELFGKHEVESFDIMKHINRFTLARQKVAFYHSHTSDGSVCVEGDFVDGLFDDILETLYSLIGIDIDDLSYVQEKPLEDKETKESEVVKE